MTVPPGTRIPSSSYSDRLWEMSGLVAKLTVKSWESERQAIRAYWRGLGEGLTLGAIAGSFITACCLALAWSHWGG